MGRIGHGADQFDPLVFEQRVRDMARWLWPHAVGGASMDGGFERDGVFSSEDVIHIVEATTSRQVKYVSDKCKKLSELIKYFRRQHPDKDVRGWIITREEPTGDQNQEVVKFKQLRIKLTSYAQFSSRLVDAARYLELRSSHFYGSARNIGDLNDHRSVGEYIKPQFIEESREGTATVRSFPELIELLEVPKSRLILLGDYGSGKSMTLREIYLVLGSKWSRETTRQFPVYINLREHWGQSDPVEVLERHARLIGFPEPSQIVRAWRANRIILLLDGFDELAVEGWAGQGDRLRELRRSATRMIQQFVRESHGTALVVAGRSHFFDDREELERALGLGPEALYILLNDFTEYETKLYLKRFGLEADPPDWLPSRPLLLGHLALKGILNLLPATGSQPEAEGWRLLLTLIGRREADLSRGIFDGAELEAVLGRIATLARATPDGLGPIEPDAIFAAFRAVVGRPAGDSGQTLLLRLPGLAASAGTASARSFVDTDLADAARAIDLAGFFANPRDYGCEDLYRTRCSVGPLGGAVAAIIARERALGPGEVSAAMRHAAGRANGGYLVFDGLRALGSMGEAYRGPHVTISDIAMNEFELEEDTPDFSHVTFHECHFGRVSISKSLDPDNSPRFDKCIVEGLLGRVSRADLPHRIFDPSCNIEAFSISDRTTRGLMQLDLPLGVKVLLTTLKKLFLQPGGGRQESALYRGLDQPARNCVEPVLAILQTERLAERRRGDRRRVWVPARSEYQRVFAILNAPSQSKDPSVLAAAKI
jgi:hypothetical protein